MHVCAGGDRDATAIGPAAVAASLAGAAGRRRRRGPLGFGSLRHRVARCVLAALALLSGTAAAAGEVTGVTFRSTPTGAYAADQEIRLDVAFDEAVTVTGTPTFTLLVGRQQRRMTYDADNSATAALRFVYEVRTGDLDEDGVSYRANALQGGRIVSGNPATAVDRTVDAIGRAPAQRVDAVAPRVDYVRFTSNSGSDLFYGIGDTVEVTVYFDEPVTATGSVTLTLDVGADEAAVPLDSTDGAEVVFEYTVDEGDEDADGISMAGNALGLGATGRIVDAVGNAAVLRLNQLPSGSAHRVDGIAPLAGAAPRVVSRPRSGVYRAGEWIEVALTFSEAVEASAGALTLLVGDRDDPERRTAALHTAGSRGRQVAFRYRVQATDEDADGISVNANAVANPTIRDRAGNAWQGRHAAMPEQAAHRVEGCAPPPIRVDGNPEVTSRPGDYGYAVGDAIDVRVRFTCLVFRSAGDPPAFTLRVGEADRDMGYREGSGTNALEFRYTVVAGDLDADGVGWQANAITGTIADTEGTRVDATVRRVARAATHTVDGVAPALRAATPVRLTSTPAAGEVYRSGEKIEVSVAFSEPVEAVHAPDLVVGLRIGTGVRQATLESGDGTEELTFEYTVQDGDSDSDGIAVTGLTGGSIRDLAGNTAAAVEVSLAAQRGHRVDGSAPAGTTVTIVSDAGDDDTYAAGDRILIELSFEEDVTVSGEPYLALTVGSLTRRAALERTRPRLLVFGYDVQPGDIDRNGVSVAAGALVGGSITDTAGNPVARALTPLADAEEHLVDAVAPVVEGVAILSAPEDEEGYDTGEVIEVGVTWDEVVYVQRGRPGLLLSIGAESRNAGYVGGSGTQTLRFRYEVQAGDRDDDGISIAPDALVGGVIEDAGGNDWEEGEEERRIPAVPAQPGHLVFARTPGVPVVEGVAFAPPTGNAFGLGDRIEAVVTFDRNVFVTGDPVLILSIGGRSREAALSGGGGTARLVFAYAVRVGDRDDDGISVPANALRLPAGATVTDEDGNPAVLDFRALAADSALRVDGGGVGVGRVWIASAASGADGYAVGDVLEVRVAFDAPVHVTGAPVLTLAVGGGNREMALVAGSGSDTLTFRYTVVVGDVDEDGVSIGANALTGGTIEDGAGRPVSREFAALPADPEHRVGASARITAVTGVTIVSRPAQDRTYLAGEAIDVAVTFDGVVHVSGEPVLAVLVGGGTRDAALVSGSGTDTLTFRYVVREGDVDDDGLSVAANALTGGVIEDAEGTAVTRDFAALPADPAHRVDAVGPVVSGVRIVSTPEDNATYEAAETVEVAVTFDEAVHVTGDPVLTLSIGTGTRQAALASGSGTTTLLFAYRVREGDGDDDGVSVAANALTGGVIEDAGGNAVSRAFAALPADAGHRVDAVAPTVSEVRIDSTPAGNGAYGEDEVIEFVVTFNEVVHVTGSPVLTLSLGGGTREAALASGSGTSTLRFGYAVREGDRDDDGISVAANALTGGVIEDSHGNGADRTFEALPAAAAHKVDALTPAARVVDLGVSSRPADAGTYAEGEGIEITVTFDRAVHVTGDPVLTLSVGGRSRAAALVSGSGTPALVFRYVVQSGDVDDDGVSVAANALSGGTIEDGDGQAADLGFEALEAQDGHRVGPEIRVALEVPALSIGTPWTADVADVLAEVGVRNYGSLVARSEHPGVVSAHAAGTVVTVTPLREGVGTVVVTATKARLVLSLAVTVGASTAEKAVLGDALATIGRGLLWSATNTIGTRLDMAGDGGTRPGDVLYAVPESGLRETGWSTGGPADGVPGAIGGHPDAAGLEWQTTGHPTRRDFGFEMPLIGVGTPAVSWGVWGGGDYWAFDSEPDAGAYDGDMTSGYLGVDARGEAWVAGVAVSHARADVSYEFGGDAPGAGTLETELTTVHPYVQWSPHERARLWAILGFGTGEALAVRDGEDAGAPADLSMSMGVAGLRFDLGSPLGVDLAVRGDAGFAELETGDGLSAVEDLSVGVHQVRLGVEGSWPLQLGGGTFVPFVDIGGRFDGGDGQTGGALEVAGGVRFRSPNVGVELKGRTVAMHAVEGYSESGLSAAIVVGPSTDGRGWSLSLAPRWGGAADMTDMLWRRDYRRGIGGVRPGWGLAGRVGYGAGLRERPGLITSFGEFDLSARDRRRVRLGVSYRLRGTSWQPPVYLELAGERVEIYPVETDHRLVLTGRAHF